ncbi:MAG: hypothetical protein GVY19_01245 [Bacteroidetes bacterium]|nr:hypothetical protein [Bacteroidota bacterium]
MERTINFKIGGALRYNYQFRDWSQSHKNQGGDFTFDTWRINVDGQAKGVLISLEYRFYSGYHMFHHGWFGYNITPKSQIQLGISKVPFGIMPYASHSWWFQTPYYVGLEDDYDMGLKLTNDFDKLQLDVAYYKTAEPTLSGSSIGSARYSYDVVPAAQIVYPEGSPTNEVINPNTPGPAEDSIPVSEGPQPDTVLYSANKEVNQFNVRATYEILEDFQIGVSGEFGGIYNQDVDKTGSHWAAAVHATKNWGDLNLLAEYVHYKYDLPEAPGQTPNTVVMGAYDAPYKVATEAQMYLIGMSYTFHTNWGPISSLTIYDNYTYMDKQITGFQDTQQHVIGCLVSAGQLFTYIDFAMGKNHPWLGDYGSHWNHALARGAVQNNEPVEEPKWHTRFNINFGYYF